MYEYMAPEIINGEKHEPSVDFYALGVVAHEMMFGQSQRPYKGLYPHEMKKAFQYHYHI